MKLKERATFCAFILFVTGSLCIMYQNSHNIKGIVDNTKAQGFRTLMQLNTQHLEKPHKCKDTFENVLNKEVWSEEDDSGFSSNRCINEEDNVEIYHGVLILSAIQKGLSCRSAQLISRRTEKGTVCANFHMTVYPGYVALFERSTSGEPQNKEQRFGISFTSSQIFFYGFEKEGEDVRSTNSTIDLGFDPSAKSHQYCIQPIANKEVQLWVDNKLLASSLDWDTPIVPVSEDLLSNFLIYSPTWLPQYRGVGISTIAIEKIIYDSLCKAKLPVLGIVFIAIGCFCFVSCIALCVSHLCKPHREVEEVKQPTVEYKKAEAKKEVKEQNLSQQEENLSSDSVLELCEFQNSDSSITKTCDSGSSSSISEAV